MEGTFLFICIYLTNVVVGNITQPLNLIHAAQKQNGLSSFESKSRSSIFLKSQVCKSSCSVCDQDGACLECAELGVQLPDCKTPCVRGHFGRNCKRRCGTECLDGGCEKRFGHCLACRDVGVTVPSCKIPCMPGTFGKHCRRRCPEPCSDSCDRHSGLCTACDIGEGPHCTVNCALPEHRDACSRRCPPRCMGWCDTTSKRCAICSPGFKSPQCEMPCDQGTFGSQCKQNCSIRCNNRQCDPVSGECLGCIDGFVGKQCNGRCITGFYGPGCLHVCPETCLGKQCSAETGACEKCLTGYTGANCDMLCESGTYGNGCVLKCPPSCRRPCDPVTGDCQECVAGVLGLKCNMTCGEGTYGIGCNMTCPIGCLGGVCSPATGDCSACKKFFHGPKCVEFVPSKVRPIEIVVYSVISLLLPVVLLGVVMTCYKYYRSSSNKSIMKSSIHSQSLFKSGANRKMPTSRGRINKKSPRFVEESTSSQNQFKAYVPTKSVSPQINASEGVLSSSGRSNHRNLRDRFGIAKNEHQPSISEASDLRAHGLAPLDLAPGSTSSGSQLLMGAVVTEHPSQTSMINRSSLSSCYSNRLQGTNDLSQQDITQIDTLVGHEPSEGLLRRVYSSHHVMDMAERDNMRAIVSKSSSAISKHPGHSYLVAKALGPYKHSPKPNIAENADVWFLPYVQSAPTQNPHHRQDPASCSVRQAASDDSPLFICLSPDNDKRANSRQGPSQSNSLQLNSGPFPTMVQSIPEEEHDARSVVDESPFMGPVKSIEMPGRDDILQRRSGPSINSPHQSYILHKVDDLGCPKQTDEVEVEPQPSYPTSHVQQSNLLPQSRYIPLHKTLPQPHPSFYSYGRSMLDSRNPSSPCLDPSHVDQSWTPQRSDLLFQQLSTQESEPYKPPSPEKHFQSHVIRSSMYNAFQEPENITSLTHSTSQPTHGLAMQRRMTSKANSIPPPPPRTSSLQHHLDLQQQHSTSSRHDIVSAVSDPPGDITQHEPSVSPSQYDLSHYEPTLPRTGHSSTSRVQATLSQPYYSMSQVKSPSSSRDANVAKPTHHRENAQQLVPTIERSSSQPNHCASKYQNLAWQSHRSGSQLENTSQPFYTVSQSTGTPYFTPMQERTQSSMQHNYSPQRQERFDLSAAQSQTNDMHLSGTKAIFPQYKLPQPSALNCPQDVDNTTAASSDYKPPRSQTSIAPSIEIRSREEEDNEHQALGCDRSSSSSEDAAKQYATCVSKQSNSKSMARKGRQRSKSPGLVRCSTTRRQASPGSKTEETRAPLPAPPVMGKAILRPVRRLSRQSSNTDSLSQPDD